MDCKKTENLSRCNCKYEPCERKGLCCECLAYHLRSRELPACAFPNNVEKNHDRRFERFAKLVSDGEI
ncbi:MAG TPA: cytosolic protein [Candidatus Altiarchaeales archaeon]|nr:cytosolic protein [Candidatus Altiarchaeales archaeon]